MKHKTKDEEDVSFLQHLQLNISHIFRNVAHSYNNECISVCSCVGLIVCCHRVMYRQPRGSASHEWKWPEC